MGSTVRLWEPGGCVGCGARWVRLLRCAACGQRFCDHCADQHDDPAPDPGDEGYWPTTEQAVKGP